ncbi:hypothetical protein B296_00018445 [Ensete ventricosum]|uniref:Uncharacterized protein n=1 Tax=Ensete ventricosum TaxID=4639 RepID=A0A426ZCT5_ENSVE|nr:hypothetical protein B296_00018445 [Ensete ventricosum]
MRSMARPVQGTEERSRLAENRGRQGRKADSRRRQGCGLRAAGLERRLTAGGDEEKGTDGRRRVRRRGPSKERERQPRCRAKQRQRRGKKGCLCFPITGGEGWRKPTSRRRERALRGMRRRKGALHRQREGERERGREKVPGESAALHCRRRWENRSGRWADLHRNRVGESGMPIGFPARGRREEAPWRGFGLVLNHLPG